ncbi:helix-turn-helix transcriptional regulator [Actinomadura bangladeshensis]|uniref:helix-turn-helix domain-containing protein n=1 Tax=Actinomadura bangladeshensis TaxID=453573 RepID=UPI0030B8538C
MRNQPWSPATFKALLERILAQTGMTQAELAALIPMHPSQITRWKTGRARPEYDRLKTLGAALRERHPGLRIGEAELLAAAGYGVGRSSTDRNEPQPAGETIDYPSWAVGDPFFEHIYRGPAPDEEKLIAIRAVTTHREALSGVHRVSGQKRA